MEQVAFNNAVFQNLLENIPGMLYRTKFEPSWPMLYVSKGSFVLTGFYPEELINAKVDFADLIHPDDRDWVWEHFTINLAQKEQCNCEYRLITKEGKLKWVREIANGIYDNYGDLLYIEGYIIDISEKKEHSQIISTLETHVNSVNANGRRLKALLNAIPDTLIRINISGKCFTYSNDKDCGNILGEDFDKDLNAYFQPEIAQQFLHYTRKTIQTGKGSSYEYEVLTDQEHRYFEARFVKSGEDEVISIIRDITDSVKIKEEINEAKEFYKNLINSVNIDIAVFDKENRYKLLSKSAIHDDNLREWIIGKDDFDYCKERRKPIKIAETRRQMLNLAGDLKRPVEWMEEIEDENGKTHYFVRTLKPFYGSSQPGSEQYKLGLGFDITALKVIQNELLRREQLLSYTHKLAKLGYWVHYTATNTWEWSDSFYDLLEADKTQISPSFSAYLNFVHPEDRKYVYKILNESQANSAGFSIEYRVVTPGGKIKFVKDQSSGRDEKVDNAKYTFGIVQDITDIKKSQEALSRSEAHLRAITESSPVRITEVDRDLKITYINTLSLMKEENVLGSPVSFFISDEYKAVFEEKLRNSFTTDKVERIEVKGAGITPEDEWYEVNIGPVKDKDGRVESLVLLAQNVSDKKQNEHYREKLIKEINHRYNELMQFNYIVSHNLRAPVANILGVAGLIKSGLPPQETQEMFEYILNSAIEIDTLIKDLNNVLSARSPLNEKKEEFKLSETIQQVCMDLATQISKSNALINVDIPSEYDTLKSIKSYIQSILHQLISNAIKYKYYSRPPHISIRASRDLHFTCLEIADNGMGIDLTLYKDQVFGLYKRFSKTSEGKGLGLHMAKAQVETLGGNISIESEVGKGSTFKITISN